MIFKHNVASQEKHVHDERCLNCPFLCQIHATKVASGFSIVHFCVKFMLLRLPAGSPEPNARWQELFLGPDDKARAEIGFLFEPQMNQAKLKGSRGRFCFNPQELAQGASAVFPVV